MKRTFLAVLLCFLAILIACLSAAAMPETQAQGPTDRPLGTLDGPTTLSLVRDPFEVDNILSLAKLITTDGVAQHHTLYPFGDEDWVAFQAVRGQNYRLETAPDDGPDLDTYLELYGPDGTPRDGSLGRDMPQIFVG